MRRVLLVLVIACVGCAAESIGAAARDGEHDRFLSSKSDLGTLDPQSNLAPRVLDFVNIATLDELLEDAKLSSLETGSLAAQNIVGYRLGDDGEAGTADDQAFETLAELDAIPFVGPAAFDLLVAHLTPEEEPEPAPVAEVVSMQGTCTETVTHFRNGYGRAYPSTETIGFDVRVDAVDPDGLATGVVQVASPWALPSSLWRALCHLARHDNRPLSDACGLGAFEIGTAGLGFGYGHVSFRKDPEGYSLTFSANLEIGRDSYYDDYTRIRYSCELH